MLVHIVAGAFWRRAADQAGAPAGREQGRAGRAAPADGRDFAGDEPRRAADDRRRAAALWLGLGAHWLDQLAAGDRLHACSSRSHASCHAGRAGGSSCSACSPPGRRARTGDAGRAGRCSRAHLAVEQGGRTGGACGLLATSSMVSTLLTTLSLAFMAVALSLSSPGRAPNMKRFRNARAVRWNDPRWLHRADREHCMESIRTVATIGGA